MTSPSASQAAIQAGYAQTANAGLSSDQQDVRAVAQAFGYSEDELLAIPAGANMGLSCGNPIATAHLKPGETVVDLGSGGGLDVFLAAQKVGPTGTAIGIDMTPDMLVLANKNAMQGDGSTNGQPYKNTVFKLGHIDNIPLPDACADVVISNCVINLAPDKDAVFREIFRILKPGGRVAVSDIALKQTLPDALANSMAALVGCIAGAIPFDAYTQGLTQAGFEAVTLIDSQTDLTAYAQVDGQAACCTPPEVGTGQPASPNTSCCTPPAKPLPRLNSQGIQFKAPASTCCADSSTTNPSNAANACCDTTPQTKPGKALHQELADLFKIHNPNDYAASVKVFALKPKP